MSDPNPYDPAQTPKPLTKSQAAKRAVALSAILVATPPAVLTAVAISCGIDLLVVGRPTLNPSFRLLVLVLIPLLVLSLMVAWAIWTIKRERLQRKADRRQIRLLLLTPWTVAAMVPIGWALAFALGVALYSFEVGSLWLILTSIIGFLLPPGATLIWMLWSTWKVKVNSVGLPDPPRPSDG